MMTKIAYCAAQHLANETTIAASTALTACAGPMMWAIVMVCYVLPLVQHKLIRVIPSSISIPAMPTAHGYEKHKMHLAQCASAKCVKSREQSTSCMPNNALSHAHEPFDMLSCCAVSYGVKHTSRNLSEDCWRGAEQRSQAQLKNFSCMSACCRTRRGSNSSV